MEYNFRNIEKKWQQNWKEKEVYKVSNDSSKPKYYVLDMFPYPSGAGLHVGHPLGYIASDIYSRYKRLKGFNVLHPMGFDSFGLPAEQYAIETGQHPAETTKKNIETFKSQLDKIGFCYDWSREVQTSDPDYYKWTQKLFLELFNSYFCNTCKQAKPIAELIKKYETRGGSNFSAEQWNNFSITEQEKILMKCRLAFSSFGEVNWCEALGTVLANDEVVNGVSERGGHPVVKKKMRQWYLRITAYADRLLEGLETVDFSDSMKEMQRNWIGKSEGAEIKFEIKASPLTPLLGEKGTEPKQSFKTSNKASWDILKDLSCENRKQQTEAEALLWEALRNNQTGFKVRRQHCINNFIIDFAFLNEKILVEVDGGYHNETEQKKYDDARSEFLQELGYTVIRFSNDEVKNNIKQVVNQIKECLAFEAPSPKGEGWGEAKKLTVYTTRPDTIFGVDFMVLAPELDLVKEITSAEQKTAVEEYINYVKSRSDRERQAEVKQITGCFTGAYAINPFNQRKIPIWISEYVLAGYGTGAIMAVPCGDERDFKFAQHFNIPITNIIGEHYTGKEANPTKEAILENSDFLNGLVMKDAIAVANNKIEELGIGKRKVNYKMRDAGFSRQRYWGEPFPIIWNNGVPTALTENDLPLELPHVEKYGPGPEGEGPLANITDWVNLGKTSPQPLSRGEGQETPSITPNYYTTTPEQWKILSSLAKQNRKEATDAEDALWQELRNRKVKNCKFRRQHPIAGFIPDFVCLEQKLIIEVDGGYHDEKEQQEYDTARTEWLIEHEFKLIRFSNDEVLNQMPNVLQTVSEALSFGEGLGEVKRETSTMPGYAGSSWYFLRYMDPNNSKEFVSKKAADYWNSVDLYVGGTEHAVGHLLYSRMWTKVLFDLGYINFDEPFKKLLNQGMIQGSSRFASWISFSMSNSTSSTNMPMPHILISQKWNAAFSDELKNKIIQILEINGFDANRNFSINRTHINVNIVDGLQMNINEYTKGVNKSAPFIHYFIMEDGTIIDGREEYKGDAIFICDAEVEKMSKSKYNTVNPDELCEKYGADTFRMYEMFLGPIEQSKPWDTKGIEGVHRFIKKLWRLFYSDAANPSPLERGRGEVLWNNEKPTAEELKILHKTIKKIEEDTERFSFNTAVSAFMVAVNELADLKCYKKEILEQILILLTPYAPHIAEELWHALGNETTILDAEFPKFENKYVVESTKEYPISINGKLRATMSFPIDANQQDVEPIVLANEIVQKWLEGNPPKKIIFVKGKMINIVI